MPFPPRFFRFGRHAGTRFLAGACLAWTVWAGDPAAAGATVGAPSESEVKAMLLYNFSQFITWPERVFPKPDSPLVIGVIGRDPFGAALDQLAGQAGAGQHGIVIRRLRNAEGARGCHMLFISPSERDNLQQILLALRDLPVLTIADFDGFARRGGMIELYRNADSKVRLLINLDSARQASLAISAKLLRVAEVVGRREE